MVYAEFDWEILDISNGQIRGRFMGGYRRNSSHTGESETSAVSFNLGRGSSEATDDASKLGVIVLILLIENLNSRLDVE